MGWRGALRSLAAAQRAAERASVRRQRQYQRVAKEQATFAALQQAAFEVDQYENLLERIITVHRDCGEIWNWKDIAMTPPPVRPLVITKSEDAAERRLSHYNPSWFDKIFRRVEKKRANLERTVAAAKRADAEENRQAAEKFEELHADWMEMRDLANRILRNDAAAFRDAIDELSPLRELTDLGSGVEFTFRSDGTADATLKVNGETVIPAEVKSLLQSGKLSVKKMPVARGYELYQDYVVGAGLRIARELFALLPLHTLTVTAVSNMLDTASGRLRDQLELTRFRGRLTRPNFGVEVVHESQQEGRISGTARAA